MSLLILILVVLIVCGMLIYACDYLPLPAPFGNLVKVLIILVGAILIIQRAGVL